jgi:hypothetical protein
VRGECARANDSGCEQERERGKWRGRESTHTRISNIHLKCVPKVDRIRRCGRGKVAQQRVATRKQRSVCAQKKSLYNFVATLLGFYRPSVSVCEARELLLGVFSYMQHCNFTDALLYTRCGYICPVDDGVDIVPFAPFRWNYDSLAYLHRVLSLALI